MQNIKNLTRLGVLLAALGIVALSFAGRASAAVAMVPRPGGNAGIANLAVPIDPPPVVRTVVVGGMPGWQIAAIAIVAALAAATAAMLIQRARSVRRPIRAAA